MSEAELEVEETFRIDTGDCMKVKQVLDDAVFTAVNELNLVPSTFSEDVKLALMVIACGFAVVAQFYPLPFPESRPLLFVCFLGYFGLSGVLQFIISFIDKDTIFTTKPAKGSTESIRVRTSFHRFQEYYQIILQWNAKGSSETVGNMYVGKYFTALGDFHKDGFVDDVKKHMDRFRASKGLKPAVFQYEPARLKSKKT